MGDKSDGESDEENSELPPLNLTSFLFGNLDEEGHLEDDSFLDSASQRLGSLGTILEGVHPFVKDVLEPDAETSPEKNDKGGETDFKEKAPTSEDFSNESEMIDDDSSSDESEDDKEEKDKGNDSLLMPPPAPATDPSPIKKEALPPSEPAVATVTPLASMKPDKYKNVDVKELFPEFRPNAVLRFNRLFPIKESHKPKMWKRAFQRARKKKEDPANEDASAEKKSIGWVLNIPPPPEDPSAYEECQSVKFHKEAEVEKEEEKTEAETEEQERKGPKPTDWRYGPAQYWYDMLELPDEVPNYDYGLKVVSDEKGEETDNAVSGLIAAEAEEAAMKTEPQEPEVGTSMEAMGSLPKIEFPPDAFHMVTQVPWEEDVVWNGEDIKHKVLSKLNSKTNAAGWVPSSMSRTAGSFSQRPGVKPDLQIRLATLGKKMPKDDDDTWYSIFPVENEELVYGRWEDEVIWDTENMPRKLAPSMVSLDPNDDNIIIAIPDDIDPSTLPNEEPQRKIKIIQKHVKKSKLLLNRAGIISVVEEESPPPPPTNIDKDPFNIGNDEYYQPKEPASLIKVATGGSLLQHSTPSVQLTAPFIPTHMGPIKLRQFHRPPLKRYSHGPLSHYTAFHGVQSLYKHQRKMEKYRAAEREEAGGGDIFLMREPKDLSGKDGDLVLFEYIEENPPLLSLVGMCSKIKNYYKRKPGSDKGPNDLKYGELTYAHTSPFLGTMTPGQTIQSVENNMYRAPIYEHKLPDSDFIVIRTRTEFSIREANAFFTSGQECPLYEVPGPNSKKANNFTRDFLQVFIYRLFWKSRDCPKRIKMDDIKKAFPAHSESSIRKRLKPCAEFHRTGVDSNWWVMKPGFRLPTEEEIRAMVDPEQCAAYYSMIAAEQRLRDAGYGEKFILAQDEDDNDESQIKMDDELKVAPWNTTRAYVLAMKGKCLLQLTGPADPTGPAQEGFSYVRIPNKPTNKEEQEQQPKRTVTGTDADLRRLPLKDAKAILRKNGVPEEEIKKLSRWEVIDVVRTLATEKVKGGEEGQDSFKFSRGNRFSIAEHQERYREDCQRIFEVQNKVLASDEVLSSDEAESSEEEEDDDLDEMGKNIENMLSNKKTSNQFLREREEQERRSLKQMMEKGDSEPRKKKKDDDDDGDDETGGPNKVLRITRTFKNADGKEYTRTELVRKPLVIETYVKVRSTKDDTFIKQFATMDDQAKEEMKKEKRRIQEQLRRIKRNQEKEKLGVSKISKKKPKAKPDLKLKCGACGQQGHMRTNKACPKFIAGEFSEPMNVAMTVEDEEQMEKKLGDENPDDDLVNVDGTKVTLSGKVLKHSEEIKRKSMQLKIPKQALKAGKRKRAGTGKHCDYLDQKNYKPVKRRRIDPVITFSTALESILNEVRNMEEALPYLYPVKTQGKEAVTDYYNVIKRPMDLQTIRDNVHNKKYHSREEFLADINQMVENSATYNGEQSIITINGKAVLDKVVTKCTEQEERLMRLEKMINPLLDDNDQNALTYILDNIINEKIKSMSESWPFMRPVNKKNVKDYYEVIKSPIDLETISRKVTSHKYHSRAEFVADMELIFNNARIYNGENSDFTAKAKKLLDITLETLAPYAEHCEQLEANIREAQQRALEQAEMDSLGTSLGGDADTLGEPSEKKERRRKDLDISSDYIDVGDENSPGLLEDDLQYSSEEEDDWDEVDEQSQNPGFSVTVDPSLLEGVVTIDQPQLINYYGDGQQVETGPIFSVQTGPDGMVYAEQTDGQEMYQEQYAEYQPMDYSGGDEPVDENYDPTDFLQGLSGVEGGAVEQQQQPMQNGGQDGANLNDDLACSDSDDEGGAEGGEGGGDDMMAF